MRRSARTLILAFLAISITLASSAQAQNKAKEKPSAEATARARDAYKKGQRYFDAGEYHNAEATFREAYAAVPNPVVLLSVAECQKRAGKHAEAVSTFERYLKEKPDAKDRAEVEGKIEEIMSLPATLAVTTDPPGAKISIDGSDSGKVSPAEVEIAPGEHTVELSLQTGETVTIVEGPFAGVNAIFQAQSGKDRVLLLLDLMGRSNRLEVCSHQVVPA